MPARRVVLATGNAGKLGEMRAIKDASEIDAMRRVGAASARALIAGMASLRPGRPQR